MKSKGLGGNILETFFFFLVIKPFKGSSERKNQNSVMSGRGKVSEE